MSGPQRRKCLKLRTYGGARGTEFYVAPPGPGVEMVSLLGLGGHPSTSFRAHCQLDRGQSVRLWRSVFTFAALSTIAPIKYDTNRRVSQFSIASHGATMRPLLTAGNGPNCDTQGQFHDMHILEFTTPGGSNGTWRRVTSNGDVPPGRWLHSTTTVGKKLYVFGGIVNDK